MSKDRTQKSTASLPTTISDHRQRRMMVGIFYGWDGGAWWCFDERENASMRDVEMRLCPAFDMPCSRPPRGLVYCATPTITSIDRRLLSMRGERAIGCICRLCVCNLHLSLSKLELLIRVTVSLIVTLCRVPELVSAPM